MVRIRPERFPKRTVKKLHAKSVGPFKVIKKINENAYVLDLSADFDISPSFNIADLIAHEGLDFNSPNPLHSKPYVIPPCEHPSLHPLPNLPKSTNTDKIDMILSDEIIFTKEGGHTRYLVK
ncbi:hypothetical protein KFK09_005007 [Dendrobium nobile]|uniref:Tf2-1-like SH3-like domain-containing protein n=1 Tax=Dendrobium nobile TaxID=94219 RepID=A0A8T3BX12_DENNO|nr:hypothetical protein KFK09_005007 [Dendrobium nobile]